MTRPSHAALVEEVAKHMAASYPKHQEEAEAIAAAIRARGEEKGNG